MEPVESANRWHQWSVRGEHVLLARVLKGLDANRPHGWQRLRGKALRPYQDQVRPGAAWYGFLSTSDPVGVTLSVERVGEGELRGGRVRFTGLSSAPGAHAWNQVMRFLDEGIIPAARAVDGVSLRVPTPEELFLGDLPPNVALQLSKFSQTTRKTLPFDGVEAELWRAFVIAAYRSRATIDAPQLISWLVRQRWEKEPAAELSQLFVEQYLLLSKYAEEVSLV